ncbi:MAG: universal stress protein [Chitinophagaceae bacterium]|nr:MAG: universal stress protein [Chitinophagaceae bacterium]
MTKLFNNIMVAIDYSSKSTIAIERAIDIANHFKCHVHLVYAEAQGLISWEHRPGNGGADPGPDSSQARLYELQNKYTYQLEPGLSMFASIRKGNKNKSIIEYAVRNQIDLVVVSNTGTIINQIFTRSFNVQEISRRLECPVLSVRHSYGEDKLHNIVLPICSALPIRKIMFASYLARKYNSRIHLLAIANERSDANPDHNQYLHKAYQLLRDNTTLSIECHTMRGHNIADTTLRFSEKINADLIVVNPGEESMLSGFVNKLLKGTLFNESRIPVMTISAA